MICPFYLFFLFIVSFLADSILLATFPTNIFLLFPPPNFMEYITCWFICLDFYQEKYINLLFFWHVNWGIYQHLISLYLFYSREGYNIFDHLHFICFFPIYIYI